MRYSLLLVTLASLASASPITSNQNLAPLYGTPDAALGSYIVVLKSGEIASAQSDVVAQHHNYVRQLHAESSDDYSDYSFVGTGLHHIYDFAASTLNEAFHGYSLLNVTSNVLDQIRSRPEVDYVEHDQLVWTQDNVPYEYKPATHITTEKGAPWGLARISHRKPLSLGTFNKYIYDDRGGEGVDAYVIDTGVRIDHEDFEGRAFWGKTIPVGDPDEDGNGHGTHCAGTIGGATYGVAKGVHIYAVKVLRSNGSGTMSDVLSGVLWAAKTAQDKFKSGKIKGSVANMSLGGGKSRALDDAVNRAVESGMHFAVAAGNDNRDACDYSPAGAKKAVTVGASTLWDERASFSNFGQCVDILAPGLNIKSTWNTHNTSTNVISGTSMASPHTCGYMAYLLSLYSDDAARKGLSARSLSAYVVQQIPSSLRRLAQRYLLPSWAGQLFDLDLSNVAPIPMPISPALLKNTLLELGTVGVLSNLDSTTPNLLLFNNATSS